jgi:hypothetical protein
MRITESALKQIIIEEARRILEGELPGPHFRPGSVRRPGLGKFASFEPPEGEWEPDPFDDYVSDEDEDETSSDVDELDEGKKKHKASAGTLAAFKKGAKGKKGGERKKRHAGFDAAMKSAEKWADDPAAVAQAATIKATGKPVVAKGEKRKVKESFTVSESELVRIIREELLRS